MQSIKTMAKEKKLNPTLRNAMEKKKLLSLKEVKTGLRDLRNDMVFHSGEEQTRKNRQLMMGDKPSRNLTVT